MSSPNPYTPPYTGANPFLHQTFPLSQSLGPSHPSQAPLAPSSSQVSNLNSRPGHPQLHPEPSFTPATVEPPRKRPRRHLSEEEERLYNLARLSDADAWSYSDIDILAAFETRCESKVYGHFVKSVSRTESGGTRRLTIMLACKHGDPRHLTHARERCKQGSGTSNLVSAVRACDARRQHASQAKDVPGYTLAHHRMLIVIRCARRKRSFRSVQDAEYLEELQLVAQDPTISVPCERTIQRDTERLYEGLAPSLTAYFKHRNRPIHVLLDGWTSPIHTSNIGIVLVWDDGGQIHRVLLELVKLGDRHTGEYLAKMVGNTLNLYEIGQFLHLLNQDNATNCDTTAIHLPSYIPTFRGLLDRLRCFLHCVQLAVKMMLSFFNKQYKRKRAGAVHTGSSSAPTTSASSSSAMDAVEAELEEILGEAETEAEELQRLLADAGRGEHDEQIVKGVREQAIRGLAARGIVIPSSQAAAALRVLPKHAALAVKTRDQGPVRDKFDKLVDQYPPDPTIGCYQYISPRNATRWDTEHALLMSYHALRIAIEKLIEVRDLKLSALRLTPEEWQLSSDLCDMLAPVHEVTKVFQQRDVPLIVDVIPAYNQLQRDFQAMADCEDLPNVCRVAAYSGYLMTRKYYKRTDECDAYVISIVMCPDRKLQWFLENGWSAEDVQHITQKVVRRFYEMFPPLSQAPGVGSTSTATSSSGPASTANSISVSRGVNRWRQTPAAPAQPVTDPDDIMIYLSTPRIILPLSSNVLQYWDKELNATRRLATFALAFTSAPATTADAERAFSEGRNQVNWNQRSMSSQTFRAKMSLGAWSQAPWFNKDEAAQIIADESRPLRSLYRSPSQESLA